MSPCRLISFCILIFSMANLCQAEGEPLATLPLTTEADKTITLLFTNDVESAYDPIPAFWLDDVSMIGGIAEMTTLIQELC